MKHDGAQPDHEEGRVRGDEPLLETLLPHTLRLIHSKHSRHILSLDNSVVKNKYLRNVHDVWLEQLAIENNPFLVQGVRDAEDGRREDKHV